MGQMMEPDSLTAAFPIERVIALASMRQTSPVLAEDDSSQDTDLGCLKQAKGRIKRLILSLKISICLRHTEYSSDFSE